MIKTATKAEVVQVAKDLLDPLLEGLHQDIANLRAEVVTEGKEREAQDTKMVAALAETRAEGEKLRGQLHQNAERIREWGKVLSEVKQTRDQVQEALRELQLTQAKQRDQLKRIANAQGRIMARLMEGSDGE